MKKFVQSFFILAVFVFMAASCRKKAEQPEVKLRGLADTVGFAHTARQMDSLMQRIDRLYGKERQDVFQLKNVTPQTAWQLVICPHDDYTYAGDVYPYVLQNLSARTIILFGVAHKARRFGVENQIVFDSFTHWRGPYGRIAVSPIREEIMHNLPEAFYQVNDSLQEVEHSVEALLPFIQYYHRQFQIVSILVPYMRFDRMQQISRQLAGAINTVRRNHQWKWGKDFALAISNDCVHYGDQDWGGKNFARFGADSAGYRAATNYDLNIISECLIDDLDPQRIRRFVDYTVRKDDYREYAWTWCGRYSVPFGLLTGYYLQKESGRRSLTGTMLKYSTSLVHPPISVSDLKMGITAPANIHHWVAYVGIGYRSR